MLKQTTKVDYNLSDLNTQSGREKKSRSTDTSFSEFLPYIQTSLETKIPMSETKLRSDFNRSAVDEKIRVSERDGRYKRQTSAASEPQRQTSENSDRNEQTIRDRNPVDNRTENRQRSENSQRSENTKVNLSAEKKDATLEKNDAAQAKSGSETTSTESVKNISAEAEKQTTNSAVDNKSQKSATETSKAELTAEKTAETSESGKSSKNSKEPGLAEKIQDILKDFGTSNTKKPDLKPFSDQQINRPSAQLPNSQTAQPSNSQTTQPSNNPTAQPTNSPSDQANIMQNESRGDKLQRLFENGKSKIEAKVEAKVKIEGEFAGLRNRPQVLNQTESKTTPQAMKTPEMVENKSSEETFQKSEPGLKIPESGDSVLRQGTNENNLAQAGQVKVKTIRSAEEALKIRKFQSEIARTPSQNDVEKELAPKETKQQTGDKSVLQSQQSEGGKQEASNMAQQGQEQKQESTWGKKSSGFRVSGLENLNQNSQAKDSTPVVNRQFSSFVKGAASAPRSEVTTRILQIVQQYNQSGNGQTVFKLDGGEFGKLDISFTKSDENTRILILVNDENSKNMLNKILPDLKQSLEDQGLGFTSIETAFKENEESNNQQQQLNGNGLPKLSEDERDELLDFSESSETASRNFGYNTMEITA